MAEMSNSRLYKVRNYIQKWRPLCMALARPLELETLGVARGPKFDKLSTVLLAAAARQGPDPRRPHQAAEESGRHQGRAEETRRKKKKGAEKEKKAGGAAPAKAKGRSWRRKSRRAAGCGQER